MFQDRNIYLVDRYWFLNELVSKYKLSYITGSVDDAYFILKLRKYGIEEYNSDIAIEYLDSGNRYLLWRNYNLVQSWISFSRLRRSSSDLTLNTVIKGICNFNSMDLNDKYLIKVFKCIGHRHYKKFKEELKK